MQIEFSILSWGAWSPEYQCQSDWLGWKKSRAPSEAELACAPLSCAPKLPQVPAMQRRRFSRLTKMMLEVAFQAEPEAQCRTIFASRHGELHRTIGILEDIIAKQPLSPTAFSQSVHNTASGILSIITGNTAASTSVAAGDQTLSQAMIEAYGQLHENATPLLLVFGDDPVPPVYDEFTAETELPLALGLQLAPADVRGIAKLKLSSKTAATDAQYLSYGAFIHALAHGRPLDGLLANHHWQLSYD
ncbi:beta-ketoacyl synthase chain length factor [Shewanella sp. AS16]|uniref:beta-ketoacyl synthase chain length factor n=1 Tax=Shewanella sp. AS16 TaxID=2907625 RepID=UPI001F1DC295|nr:beta-ketoacyl synthase chain length factor [Shewanella sp. AS16]MCE9687932.1 beta-ketoacyl synthase chain length factor [Shewanella sp. AS16]